MLRLRVVYFVVLTILFFSAICEAEQNKTELQKSKINQLTEIGIKAYELDLHFIEQYQSALKHISAEAGEGLFQELFADPIILFNTIIKLEKDNFKAHLYLGKSYHRKAYEGEGNWNKDLTVKAKEEYMTAVALSKKVKVDKSLMKDLSSELEDVEKILKGD